jgi:hypothetical protein
MVKVCKNSEIIKNKGDKSTDSCLLFPGTSTTYVFRKMVKFTTSAPPWGQENGITLRSK